jgi:hypothetical protein
MRAHVVVALAVAVLASACQKSPPGQCGEHLECLPGQECSGGVCIPLATDRQAGSRCIRDTDCMSWAECLAEVCTLKAGACGVDGDCAAWESCEAHACAAVPGMCGDDTDCQAWQQCAGGNVCVLTPGMCATSANCSPWQTCDAGHLCVLAPNGCQDDAGCAGWQDCVSYRCATAPGFCGVEADCASWQDCGGAHTCVTATGYCAGAGDCASWEQCGAGHTCELPPGSCGVEADCAAWEDCDTTVHACTLTPGMCGTNADCASWDVCDATNVCAHGPGYCESSAGCSPWEECDAVHACVAAPGFCSSAADCQVWELCNASHTCENGPGYCASSAECAAWQECDAVHACVTAPGFCGTATDCETWEFCGAGHTCEIGAQYCAADDACEAWQQCGAEHACVPGLRRCDTDADCDDDWQACGPDHTCETAPDRCLDSSDCTAPQLCITDHRCSMPPANCTSDRDCPWYTRCEGGLGPQTCQVVDAIGYYPQHCTSDADCGGLVCRDNRCVETWRVTQVATGETTCALTSDQQVWCWGWGNQGLLGADQTVDGGPYPVVGSDGAVALATSAGTGFLTFADGSVRGWGYNDRGQLCDLSGNPEFYGTPGPVIPALAGVTNIHGYPICGIDTSSNLVCWGDNTYGPIPGAGGEVETPTPIAGLPSGVTAFDARNHVCAIVAGELWCWGGTFANDCGQTGRTPGVTDAVPTRVDLGAPVLDVATGGFGFTCAIVEGGAVKCWGCNYYGTIGNGSTSVDPVLVPTSVVGLAGPAVHVEAADWTACALLASGGVQCWGRGDLGYLGTGDAPEAQVKPRYVAGLESGVTQLDMGRAQCAVKSDGTLWCWGNAHDWTISGDFRWPFYYPVQVNGPPP